MTGIVKEAISVHSVTKVQSVPGSGRYRGCGIINKLKHYSTRLQVTVALFWPSCGKRGRTLMPSSSLPRIQRCAVLFIERQTARGVYVLCEGEVKLSVSSSEGKKLILRIAKAGEVLGLMSALSGTPHELTAETLRPYTGCFYSS
jgi:CRP-like cAMP-binding protein